MTREEKMNEAAKLYGNSKSKDSIINAAAGYDFAQGARWADNNPKSPWIKIEDDEPCNHDELICSEDKNLTLFVIALVNNFVCLSRMEKIYDDWIWTTDVPTHWFAIPELSKE